MFIHFFTAKYKILHLHPNGHPFFKVKYKILQLHSNGHSCFYNELQNSENRIQAAICSTAFDSLSTKYDYFKLLPK